MNHDADSDEIPEGIGGQPVVDPRTSRKDMRLLRTAIKNNWPLTPAIRQLVVNQMAIVVGKDEDPRNQIAASKVLVAADTVNAKRELGEMNAEMHINAGPGSTITQNVSPVLVVEIEKEHAGNDGTGTGTNGQAHPPQGSSGPTVPGSS